MVRGPESPADPVVLLLLGLASAGLYCFGMAMNDIADLKRDREIAPTRVLPSGKISPRAAIIAALAVLALSAAGVLLIPGEGLLWRLSVWTAIVLLILAYDLRALKIPPTMGAIRALNVLLGGAAAWDGSEPVRTALLLGVPALVYVSGVTFVSILEDRKIQLPLLAIGGVWIIAGAFTPELIRWTLREPEFNHTAWIVSAALAGWIAYRTVTAKDRKGVMLIVRDGVMGVIVLDATILIAAGLIDQGIAVGFLVILTAFSVLLFKKLA